MFDVELAALKPGDVVYLRATLVEHFGDDVNVRVEAPRSATTVNISVADIVNFAPLALKRNGHDCALRIADFDVR